MWTPDLSSLIESTLFAIPTASVGILAALQTKPVLETVSGPWPNAPNFCLGPPEISKLWTLVAQIYLSGNSKRMGSSASGHFGPLKILFSLALGHHINFVSVQHCKLVHFKDNQDNCLGVPILRLLCGILSPETYPVLSKHDKTHASSFKMNVNSFHESNNIVFNFPSFLNRRKLFP